MEDSKHCILEVKSEYIDYLVDKLYRSIYRGLQKQWETSKQETQSNPDQVFKDYQLRLQSMKNMNQTILEDDYERIVRESMCDSLENIIQKCVVLSTQAIATVNQPSLDPIKVKAPKGDKFIHRCYITC